MSRSVFIDKTVRNLCLAAAAAVRSLLMSLYASDTALTQCTTLGADVMVILMAERRWARFCMNGATYRLALVTFYSGGEAHGGVRRKDAVKLLMNESETSSFRTLTCALKV